MIKNKNFKLIRPLQWEEVFLFWYECEGKRQNWIDLAKKNGFASWHDWRLKAYAEPFGCTEADWSLYEVSNPQKIIPNFYGAPFKAWIKHYYGQAKEKKFSNIVAESNILENKTVQYIIKNFPKDKVIICLEVADKIYVIEGMHRSCALSLMNAQNKQAPGKLYFAIGKSALSELPVV